MWMTVRIPIAQGELHEEKEEEIKKKNKKQA